MDAWAAYCLNGGKTVEIVPIKTVNHKRIPEHRVI